MFYPQTQPPPPAKLQLPKAKLEAKAVNEVTITFLLLILKKSLEYQIYISAHTHAKATISEILRKKGNNLQKQWLSPAAPAAPAAAPAKASFSTSDIAKEAAIAGA